MDESMKVHVPAPGRLPLLPPGRAMAAAIALAALAMGAGIPAYLAAVGDGAAALFALPLTVALAALFFSSKKTFFFLVLGARSACDLVFESVRLSVAGGGPGIGGFVNASIIGIALLVVSKEDAVRKQPLLMAWAWFFATTAYGFLLAPSKGDSLRFILAWVSNFAVFYCAATFVTSMKDFRTVLRVIVASSLIPVAYGMVQVAGAGLGALSGSRVQGTFTHPNIFAFYLAFVICIVFYQLKSPLQGGGLFRKAALVLWMAVLAAMLVCTQTRSAWLVCLALFLCFGLLYERRYLLYLLAACCLALMVEPIRDRLIDLSAPEVVTSQTKLDSFRWRVELWTAALDWMEWKRALFGYGIGAFSDNAPVFFARGDGIHWDAHNVYVQWLFDAGLLGLAAYAWIHCRLLYLLRRLAQVDRLLRFIVVVTVVSYLTVSFSDNMMFYLAFNWYYWLFLGAASSLLSVPAEAPPQQQPASARAFVVRS
jgi:O-antigen ligase